jgi:HD-GYP domain-containing protein (c-di-GMP phosphodiesterase class II)
MAPVVMADDREAVPHLVRHLAEDLPLLRRAGRIASALTDPGGKARSLSAHCEVGQRLAGRIGLPEDVTLALAHAYERWDGKGLPDGVAGDDVPLATRVVVVARDFDVWRASRGLDDALAMLVHRRGRAYDPAVVDAFIADSRAWCDALEAVDVWDAALDAEGNEPVTVGDDQFDEVLLAFADFTDLKSPWFRGHSRRVSELAAAAAAACGLGVDEAAIVRRAGLVHDIGIVGVPSGVWDRSGRLSAEAWERVRLHPYLSERILARCPGLADLAVLAGAHHERADGSGYHRGSSDAALAAQLLAAADVLQALGEARPHRPNRTPPEAAVVLADPRDAGVLASAAVDAVLAASGQTPAPARVERPAGLTEREVDVLRRIARGRSNKEAARDLGISAKTVGTHIEHIYAKAGVTTRAGATLFAMENDLLGG